MIPQPIILYDGVCGLCDRSIQFVLKHDHLQQFRYAALQSDFAKQLLGPDQAMDSFVLYQNGKVYKRSTAALKVLMLLGGFWKFAGIFWIVPAFLRDAAYDFIARNRYQWFGKFDQCKIPTPEQRSLFLDMQ